MKSPLETGWPSRAESSPPDYSALQREVHVWKIGLTRSRSDLERLMRILSADELAKAGRFHFERDRDRFIVARGELRKVLAGYLEVDPASLTFCYGARGKPSLESESLQFNLSHSGSLALLALAR